MTTINHEVILKHGNYKCSSINGIDQEIVLDIYNFMLRLRRLQEEIYKEYHPADEMRCPVHFCIGQEAIPAALSALIKKNDFLFGPHRSHGYYFAKGGSMKALLAELYGRKTGANGGKAGSQDISSPHLNFHSGAIISGTIGIAVGAALGIKFKSNDIISVVGFGDAATEQGIFYEAISYASMYKLPVIFICENNNYSTYSPQSKRQPFDNVHERVPSFGVKSCAMFGNDVISVYSALANAMNYVRTGNGPYYIEAYTYRWKGHVGPEDDDYIGYRPQSEIDFWKNNCPISLLEEQMISNSLLTSSLKEEFIGKIDKEIAKAFNYAKTSPFPDDIDYEKLNYCLDSPVADKLLQDEIGSKEFNNYQPETIPGPY